MEGLGREVGGGGGPKGLMQTLYVASGDPRVALPRPPSLEVLGDKAMYEATGPQPPQGAHGAHAASGATPFLSLRARLSAFHTPAGPQVTAMTPTGACSGGQSTDAKRAEGVRLVFTHTDASGWGQE